jgi:L-aspartate oxidase
MLNNIDADTYVFDVLIIGSGSAGLMSALTLSKDLNVGLVSKNNLNDCCSFFAQGGISAVLDKKDSFENHINDTLKAAAGLGDEKAIRFMVENGPSAIQNLKDFGVEFSQENNHYHLTKEGGHSQRRIVHKADKTGEAVQNTLIKQTKKRKNITIFENHIAIDLIKNKKNTADTKVIGAYVLNKKDTTIKTFLANDIILATGGSSKVYLYTSNPDTSTGCGVAMAYRLGCEIVNMEFTQFHPTCLYHKNAKSFLISESLRGEGAKLILADGSEFMHNYDEKCELAARDIVARAIDNEMKTKGLDCVYLDISFKDKDWIKQHFPKILKTCLSFGIDICKEPIPVVPAAHYSCGGIKTNLNGETDVKNLYAIGEVAWTGVHGANRLASNSLLECLVFAKSCANKINNKPNKPSDKLNKNNAITWDDSRVRTSYEKVVVSHLWDELRLIMWNFVGIVRSNKRLNYAHKKITQIQIEVDEYYRDYYISNDLIELRNLTQVSKLIIESALERQENRGLHFNLDTLNKHTQPKNTVLKL